MKQIPTLETARLLLRPFRLDDAADVQRLAGDWAIADTTLNLPHPYPDGAAEEWISSHQEKFDRGEALVFAIERKADSILAGAIGLHQMVPGHQAEMGYWIGKPYWQQGYCTEAGEGVLNFAFTDLGLVRVHACHFSRNPASGRVMQKLGMRHEGTRRQHVEKWGRYEDLELYGVLREEWEKSRSSLTAMC
ncbi:MAG TPA: GNAT family N-acetyltransferase [bacterium]|nr:GNAT family N-acetyltransferase [bacterium]